MAKTATRKSRYQPHPMLDRERKAMVKLQESTGKSWKEWIDLAQRKGPKERKALAEWLKKEHGHAPMMAQWLAYGAVAPEHVDYGEPEPMVDALYSGKSAPLRPLHEKVVDAVLALGDDVVVTACQTMVPVYRKHVFAELKPGPAGVEVRLALGEVPAKGRLSSAKRMPGDRLTHVVVVAGPRDVDAELRGWIADAYANGAGKMERAATAKTPPDFAKALAASKPATKTWESMTPAMRREMIEWVVSAKQAETRARRVTKCTERLSAGHKRMY